MKKRERFLLVVLAAMVILLGGYKFLIEPQIKSLSAAGEELQQAKEEQLQAESNLRRAADIATANKTLEEKVFETYKVFFPELENDNVHIFFEDLAATAGVTYTSFLMSEKAVTSITPFVPLEGSVTYPAKDSASSINIMNGTEEPQSTPATPSGSASQSNSAAVTTSSEVEKIDISIQFQSGYTQMNAFLDAVKNSGRTVRITSVSIVQSESAEGETSSGSLGVSLSVECFGVKKISPDALSEDALQFARGKTSPF